MLLKYSPLIQIQFRPCYFTPGWELSLGPTFMPLWLFDFNHLYLKFWVIFYKSPSKTTTAIRIKSKSWHNFQTQFGNNFYILPYFCLFQPLYCWLNESLLSFTYDFLFFDTWASATLHLILPTHLSYSFLHPLKVDLAMLPLQTSTAFWHITIFAPSKLPCTVDFWKSQV